LVLYQQFHIAEIFVGGHFAFGKGRAGGVADLLRLGEVYGFKVHPMRPITYNGAVVSSTRIRQLIQAGDVRQAAGLLGRLYSIQGTVMAGRRQGQALGWPTANLPVPPQRVIPPDGVYAARTVLEEDVYEAVAYIGTRPTFGMGERLIEVNLLDQQRDLYGQEIVVEFVERLRGDRAFSSPEDLSVQIARDVDRAREYLRQWSHETR
jgi:riboflavin kinase/FMN adenylyltransferase